MGPRYRGIGFELTEPLPVSLAFDVYISSGDQEVKFGSLVCAAASTDVAYDQDYDFEDIQYQEVTVILKSNPELATSTPRHRRDMGRRAHVGHRSGERGPVAALRRTYRYMLNMVLGGGMPTRVDTAGFGPISGRFNCISSDVVGYSLASDNAACEYFFVNSGHGRESVPMI